jgi:hypothetical protein
MKKILLALLLTTPLLANASSLVFNATSSDFAIAGYNLTPNTTGDRNVGQFGYFTLEGEGGGTFSATFLGQESAYNNLYGQEGVKSGLQIMDESALGSTVSSNDIFKFGFGTQTDAGREGVFLNGYSSTGLLGFALLKKFNTTTGELDNHTTLGDFDFLIGFNDYSKSDADYDDYVVGLKYKPNAVPVPAALPLMASAIGLFGFGARRKRV